MCFLSIIVLSWGNKFRSIKLHGSRSTLGRYQSESAHPWRDLEGHWGRLPIFFVEGGRVRFCVFGNVWLHLVFSFSCLFYFPGGHGQVGITPKSCHRVADRSKKVETLKQELGNTLSRSGKHTLLHIWLQQKCSHWYFMRIKIMIQRRQMRTFFFST